jgi:thiol-disulfide isomerase/thioredoxin
MNKKNIIVTFGIVLVVLIGMVLLQNNAKIQVASTDDLKEFAKCITDSGAKFYGATWCPHCQNQKREFGEAIDLIPYIECATEDMRKQAKVCQEAKIESYPTWDFPDGERVLGEIDFRTIAEHTGCVAPLE